MKSIAGRNLVLALLAVTLGAAPTGLFAQERSRAETPAGFMEAALGGRDMRASKLLGAEVRNPEGEKLGAIKDLIVDVKGDRVNYAVLSFEGALGLGDKLFAYPIKAFQPTPGKDELVLNVDKDKMKNAPGFERNRWPDLGKDRYRKEVDRYFEANAVGATPPGERLMRVSELIGKKVQSRDGRNAGKIEDVVVNPANERIRYAVLAFDKAWSPDDKLVPVPFAAFRFPVRDGRGPVLDATREQLANARRIDDSAWPDINTRAFRREMDAFLSRFSSERTAQPASGATGTPNTSGGSR
jgi:sporulation protein YlmC with PRC-barrel domain